MLLQESKRQTPPITAVIKKQQTKYNGKQIEKGIISRSADEQHEGNEQYTGSVTEAAGKENEQRGNQFNEEHDGCTDFQYYCRQLVEIPTQEMRQWLGFKMEAEGCEVPPDRVIAG